MVTYVYLRTITKKWRIDKAPPYVHGASEILKEEEVKSQDNIIYWFTEEMVEDIIVNGKLEINNQMYIFDKSKYIMTEEGKTYRNLFISVIDTSNEYVLSVKEAKIINENLKMLKNAIFQNNSARDFYQRKSLEQRLTDYRYEIEMLENKLFEARAWLGGFMLLSVVIMILYIATGGSV